MQRALAYTYVDDMQGNFAEGKPDVRIVALGCPLHLNVEANKLNLLAFASVHTDDRLHLELQYRELLCTPQGSSSSCRGQLDGGGLQ